MNGTGAPTLKLAVPKSVRAVVGATVGMVVLTAFLLSSIYLAIYNLLQLQGIIPSLIWLSLISFLLFGLCKEYGIKMVAIKILGAFSRKEFVQIINRQDRHNEIQFGYQAFGRHFFYFAVEADKITQIDWHTGQASSLAGKDMNDWHVALWYEHGDPIKSESMKKYGARHPDSEVYLVGLEGPKEKTTIFGHSLVDFLQKSGVSLVPGESDSTFVRPGSQS